MVHLCQNRLMDSTSESSEDSTRELSDDEEVSDLSNIKQVEDIPFNIREQICIYYKSQANGSKYTNTMARYNLPVKVFPNTEVLSTNIYK